jgi:hypothetical protein
MGEIFSNIIFSKTYKLVTTPLLRRMLEKGSKLVDRLKSDFSIEGQGLRFLCPENCEEWTIIFSCKRGLLGGKASFPFPSVRRVTIQSIIPPKDVTSKCISFLPDGGFDLHYKNLQSGVPYMLKVEFSIEDPKFVDNLVHKKVQEDSLQEHRKYWMHAQLRFIDVLEKLFSEVIFEDLNFDVRVSTHEDVYTAVPSIFKRELEVVVKWMGETDRERKIRLSMEHARLLRARRGGEIGKSILKLLQELQDIFLPKTFHTFIRVERDFYYHDCLRGTDYYTAPFPTWPKFMTIITRTNLKLDKPAAEGALIFDYHGFRKRIEDLFAKFF